MFHLGRHIPDDGNNFRNVEHLLQIGVPERPRCQSYRKLCQETKDATERPDKDVTITTHHETPSVVAQYDLGKPDLSVVSGLTYVKLIEGGLVRVATGIVFAVQRYGLYRLFHLTHRLRPGKR